MVTMKELAEVCCVSVATVSKALNNRQDVSAVTKERVRQKARELGYYPDLPDRTRQMERTQNIGVLFDQTMAGAEGGDDAILLGSFARAAEAAGYDLTLIGFCGDRSRPMTCLEWAGYSRFDGVLIVGTDGRDPQISELINSEIPVVTVGFSCDRRISVSTDFAAEARDLFRYVYSLGHRRIAFVGGSRTEDVSAEISSLRAEGAAAGLMASDLYLTEAACADAGDARAQTEKLLALAVPPTCILYSDVRACCDGIRAIRDSGRCIPADISIAVIGGAEPDFHVRPEVTAIRRNAAEIGRTAAENLIGLIENPKEAVIRPILIRSRLDRGGTVRDRTAQDCAIEAETNKTEKDRKGHGGL